METVRSGGVAEATYMDAIDGRNRHDGDGQEYVVSVIASG